MCKEEYMSDNYDKNIRQNWRDKIKVLKQEFVEVIKLMTIHKPAYIIKFLCFVIIDAVIIFLIPNNHHGLSVSAVTFVIGLLFDQITKNDMVKDFDFKKILFFCRMGIIYISIIFIVILATLLAQDFFMENFSYMQFKVFIFILTFFASFGALIEGVTYLPKDVLPSYQEKVQKSREGVK